jgi:hypothetical protein
MRPDSHAPTFISLSAAASTSSSKGPSNGPGGPSRFLCLWGCLLALAVLPSSEGLAEGGGAAGEVCTTQPASTKA